MYIYSLMIIILPASPERESSEEKSRIAAEQTQGHEPSEEMDSL